MSKEREGRKIKLNSRVQSVKGIFCRLCSNNKMHTDGSRYWCTKCKADKI